MDITNIAKDAIRIANTAGLSKDVIDLLTAKITLLDEKLIETKAAFSDVMMENQKLRKQLADLTPVQESLPEPQTKILQLLHHNESLSVEQIAGSIGISAPDTKGHLDALSADEYVVLDLNKSMGISSVIGRSSLVASRGGRQSSSQKSLGHYRIKLKGRAYAMKNG